MRVAPAALHGSVAFFTLAAFAAATCALGLDGEVNPARRWLEHARACMAGSQCVQASFTQETVSPLLEATLPVTGTLQACRDGRLRLEWDEPERRVLVCDRDRARAWCPETSVFYDVSVEEDAIVEAVVALFGEDGAALDGRFVGGSRDPSLGGRAVIEVPIAKNPVVTAAVVTLDARCPSIARLVFVDRAGNANRMTFFDVKTHLRLPPERFALKPPKGATVVRP